MYRFICLSLPLYLFLSIYLYIYVYLSEILLVGLCGFGGCGGGGGVAMVWGGWYTTSSFSPTFFGLSVVESFDR